MTKIFAAAVSFFLIALANMVFALPVSAQESCKLITFPVGKDSTVLSGSVQSEEIVCYRLDAQIGQKFDLSVLQSDDIAITIIDVEDMQDRIHFTAQQRSYQVNVYQMFRSAGPEKYRISVKRSGTKPRVEGAAEEPWQIQISLDMKRLMATQPAKDGNGRLVLTCNKDLGGGVSLSFDSYQGEALGRHDDTEYATKVVITGSRAKTRTFDLRMHYFEPDRSWVSSGNAPAGFLRAFGAGFLLTLKNGDGAEIATFDLHGSSKFSKAALVRCGDAPKFATATTAVKSGEGVSEAEATPSAAGPMGGAGQPFRDCEHCPEMVPVPPGTFMMGASQKEKRQLKYVDWELPRHQVSIAYPFAIGRFEVTVEEFDAFVKETGVPVGGKCTIRTMESGPLAFKYTGTPVPGGDKTESAPYIIYIADGSYAQPGLPVTPRQPATCVSRNEMKQYLAWLSLKSGRHYRLPTDAEWEYAYRAGTDTINFWGDDFRKTCDYANFADRKSGYQAAPAASCAEKLHPGWAAEVGSYKPNPWGLYDMAGNVQETVEDCLHESYEGAPTDGSPWTKKDCVVFVARGGDYEHTQYSMRAAERLLFGYVENGADGMWTREESSDERFNLMGFRVAVSLDGTSWDEMAQTPASEKKAELKNEVAPSPPATESGLRYGYLPAAVKKYADEVRNSCKENDPNGVPTNKMSGIRPIVLAGGIPAFLIENETLCSNHYSGANCSNRGCDVVVMTDGGDGWKEIFHEHLYDDAFDIGDGDKLKSITASIYAGDPHCDPDPNATFESSDSCDVVISYENKNWVWKKAGATKGAASKDAVVDASSSTESGCGGSYIFVQFDTLFYDPLLSRKVDRHMLEAKGNAASWYDVECDAAGRPATFTRYQFGKKTGQTVLGYDNQSSHVARQIAKNPQGDVLETDVIERDARGRPARIVVLGADGKTEKVGLFTYNDNVLDLNVVDAENGASLWHNRVWFDDTGARTRLYWYFPKYWYDYHYDPRTGLVPTQDKYNGDTKFDVTTYAYDEFGNTLTRTSKCVAICDFLDGFGKFSLGHLVHEETTEKSGDRLVWDSEYDEQGRLAISRLSANDRFVLKFVVERDGTVVKRTVAYSPKGKKLFVYEHAETVYIKRDGSPVDGGKYKRFTKRNVW